MRILLCWEIGDGHGHLRNLLAVAERATAEGHSVTFAVPHHITTFIAYRRVDIPTIPTPPAMREGWHAKTFADILVLMGCAHEQTMRRRLGDWLKIIRMSAADVVISESAPVALLAAKIAEVRSIAIGTPYCIPPTSKPWFTDYAALPGDPGKPIISQLQLLDVIEKIWTTGDSLPSYFSADTSLIGCIPSMDLYQAYRNTEQYIGLIERLPIMGVPKRKSNFAYLSTKHPAVRSILYALFSHPDPSRIYLNGDPLDVAVPPHITFLRKFNIAEEVARCTRIVHHGALGMCHHGLSAGRVQFTFPYHLENMQNCLKLHQHGTMIGAGYAEGESYLNALSKPYDSGLAQSIALKLSVTPTPKDPVGVIVEKATSE